MAVSMVKLRMNDKVNHQVVRVRDTDGCFSELKRAGSCDNLFGREQDGF